MHRLWTMKSLGYLAWVSTVSRSGDASASVGGASKGSIAAGAGAARVEVRRSSRRRRTVSAYRDGDKTIVLLPARFSPAEEKQWVARMLDRLAARERRLRPSDDGLLQRASELSARYLGGAAAPRSVRWVDNQNSRWGSCTPADGTIRLSSRLRGMPGWVLDYVLVHELAHLIVSGHGPEFWELVDGYPRAERARGYLEGVAHAAHLGTPDL
jgi:predicted metal-dependent hydrolase